MTLIELVVTISVIGAIALVLAAAVTVTFRQQADTAGNLDVARWEQALALWMPTDLASADPSTLSDDPTSVPSGCTVAECSAGSNALSLSYDDGSGTTTVTYRYLPDDQGDGYRLVRIACEAGSCSVRTILRDLAAPSDPSWTPGVDDVPASVMNVSVPDAVDGGGGGSDNNARTVTVSVNGLPDAGGVARSSMVSVTAGGVQRESLDLPTFKGPSFVDARSGCGGPVTLIVDESGSIGAADFQVRQGVESFVRAFEGTPTDLKVITFNSGTATIGTTGWHRTFDLAEPADVMELVGDATLGSGGYLGQISAGGGTDWQEALTRAFYTDATRTTSFADAGNPAQPHPELVVMFTDGVPNRDMGSPSVPPEYDHDRDGTVNSYGPRSWYRANVVAEAQRSGTRLIGVGVGPAFSNSIQVAHAGWPAMPIPNPVFLGDLIAGASTPAAYNGTQLFETVTYDPVNGWGDVSTAHVLTTSSMADLGSGLAAIALAECGGTLTVQTREVLGDPADADITYTLGAEQVTTTRINKAATFDIPFGGAPSATVQLVPQSFDGTGYTPVAWTCAAGGVPLVAGSEFSLITAGVPGAGINVTVTPNAAVSCTLEVA